MARLGVQEEEKLLVPMYISGLSPKIQQRMEFLTVNMLVDAFHYASKLEAKHKEKTCFTNKPTCQKSHKNSSSDSEKSKNPSQPTSPKLGHQKKNFQKDKRDRNKKTPTKKWCDYQSSAWHDMSECKARMKFLKILLTSDL